MALNPSTLLEEWVQNLPAKEYEHLSPSSLGGCPRVHYWKIKGRQPTTPPSPRALLNFQLGFLWEDIWQKALEWKGVNFKSQESFYDKDLNIGGTCDFLIEVDDGKWEIWDSKTQASKWFWYIQSRIKRGEYDEYKEEYQYILQQAAYIYLARKAGYDTTAKLAYISKDDGFVGKITDVYLTPEIEHELKERCNYMNLCLASNQLPECTCENWKIGYCNYGDVETREKNKTGKVVNTVCCQE